MWLDYGSCSSCEKVEMEETPSEVNTVKRTVWVFLVLFLIVLVLVGCSRSSKSVAGTYVNKANSSEYLELKANGEFYLREAGMGVAGRYEIEGDTITLKLEMGLAVRGRIRGKSIIDNEGKTWVKQ